MQNIMPEQRETHCENRQSDEREHFTVAVAEPPKIVCPEWCTVSKADHLSELQQWEGLVLHGSATTRLEMRHGEAIELNHCRPAYVDGTPDPSEPDLLHVQVNGDVGLTLDGAAELALAILRMATEAGWSDSRGPLRSQSRPDDVIHAPWCVDHEDDPTPETGWCVGQRVTIAGVETYLSGDRGEVPDVVTNLLGEGVHDPATARVLAARLEALADEADSNV